MININSLLIRSKIVELYWIPLLFGIYNIFDIIRKLNYYYTKKITKLQQSLNNTNNKFNELQNKYDKLYTEFQELNQKFNNLNYKEINELTIETDTNIVYRDLCEPNPLNTSLSDDIVISPLNNINEINEEFIESLSLDYNYNKKYFDNIRNSANTNANTNWTTVTKKFFFG
jgi:hypothetical protein